MPFDYFISHSNPALIQAVRNGWRAELAAFGSQPMVQSALSIGAGLRRGNGKQPKRLTRECRGA